MTTPNFCLVFDADNTLWDTNQVFQTAQEAILETLQKNCLLISNDIEKEIHNLRICDQLLVNQTNKYEYDFKLLIAALIWHYGHGMELTKAINHVIINNGNVPGNQKSIVFEAHYRFTHLLNNIPPLFENTSTTLKLIRHQIHNSIMILFSEGDPSRLYKIMNAYDKEMKNIFDTIILQAKNKRSFNGVKQLGAAHFSRRDSVVFAHIGDSLHRDIKFANQAGFITFYKPSAYKGNELPKTKDEQPTHIIKDLNELLAIVFPDSINA